MSAFTTWGDVAIGGLEADVSKPDEDRVATDGDVTIGMIGLDVEWDHALSGIMFSHSVGDRDTRDEGESFIEATGKGEDRRENRPTFWGRRTRRNSGSRQIVGRLGRREARTARDGRKAKDEVPATTETVGQKGVDQSENS